MPKDTATISGYHAHVYYDAASKPAAEALRAAIEATFDVRLGRWHDRPVGPHTRWSYQIAFAPDVFGVIVPWLALNRGGLTVFVHPDTGDALPDHRDHAIWLGEPAELKFDALK
ncbi:MAG: DOPA 4,5-dioxygenase family protein [Bacteroidota bacterium]|nr:DOPA 4,5-dioxygenase family protein [Kiloniellaceae bacterium]